KPLTLTGTASVVGSFTLTGMAPISPPPTGCTNSTGPVATCYTPLVTPAQLSATFYTNVLYYTVTNAGGTCTAGYAETNGANDVFSTVVRDFLVGFASGFVNSSVPAPPGVSPARTYGTMTSAQWSASAATLFQGVQPGNPYYNQWGAAVFSTFGSQVYGFQYSDYFSSTGPLGSPLLVIEPSIPVQLVIQNDAS